LSASPAGSPIAAPFDPPQAFEFYLRTVSTGLKIAASSGQCGFEKLESEIGRDRVRAVGEAKGVQLPK
jgi:hypothetical protein